jgi:predicted kinase
VSTKPALILVVAGPAGAGKSTLGRELARRTGAVLLDLDTLINPLLDRLQAATPSPWTSHWNDPEHRDVVRPARYAVLLAVAREQADLGHELVLVAPFTAELTGGPEWDLLRTAVAPAEPVVVWLQVPADVLATRLRERREPRDAGSVISAAVQPLVPHQRIDATLGTAAQADEVLAAC